MSIPYIFFALLLFVLENNPLLSTISTPYGDKIEAVIFDCDGVLVDTEHLKFLAWKEALSTQGIPFTIEEYMPVVGHSSKNILSLIEKQKKLSISKEVIKLKREKYRLLQKKGVQPIKEMVLFAQYFIQAKEEFGIKVALASSASTEEIRRNIEQIGLQDSFDLTISGSSDLRNYNDVEGTNKPKPYIYLEAAKRLGVNPSKCLVFEDTQAGVIAARSAGMITVAIPNRFTVSQDFSKASHIVNDYQALSIKNIITEE